jgi:hypothetical protein
VCFVILLNHRLFLHRVKWIAISGSWKLTNASIEAKVREVVQDIIQQGNGIVSGGALNVDYLFCNR